MMFSKWLYKKMSLILFNKIKLFFRKLINKIDIYQLTRQLRFKNYNVTKFLKTGKK